MVVKCVYNIGPLAYLKGATTLTITTLAIMTERKTTLSIAIKMLNYYTLQHSATSVVMLSVLFLL